MSVSSCYFGGMSASVQCMHMWYACTYHLVYFISWGVCLNLYSACICVIHMHFISFTSSPLGGMSESVQSMNMCYPYALHLFHIISLGGPLAKVGSSAKFCVVVCKSSLLWYQGAISDLRMHFIWKVYCHYLHYELLNTAQCRLLYVVVIFHYCCIFLLLFLVFFMCNFTWMMIYE